jgi:hypothetical protein
MTSDDALVAAIDALIACDIPHMLVGSLSSNYYGNPRSTRDADFVLQVDENSIPNLIRQLPSEMYLDRQMSFEGVTATTRHIVRVAKSSFRIELFMLSDDAHDQERFRRRVPQELKGRRIFIPTPEDVIITKLRWGARAHRRKDLVDAENVITMRSASLDWDYIHKWCSEHGTMDLLQQIRDSIPPI